MKTLSVVATRIRAGAMDCEGKFSVLVRYPVDRRIHKQMHLGLNPWELDDELIAALLANPGAFETWMPFSDDAKQIVLRYMVWPAVAWKRNGPDLRGHAVEGDEWTFPEDVGASGTAKLWGMVDLPSSVAA